jgi:ribosomal protein S18 acetylase RimI-like enzyme
MEVQYRKFQTSDSNIVTGLIQSLYREDPSDKPMSPNKIQDTFDALTNHPDRGTIILFDLNGEVIGYSILINFWSNEFGGNILTIDELYIKKAFRSQGIGTRFIQYLAETRFGNSVVIQLEVTPDNVKARKLYESLGFRLHKNSMFDLLL